MAESSFELSFSSSARDANELPTDFKFMKLLGAGTFGKVVRCLKKDTNQTVAVKIPKFLEEDSTEVSTMEKLMCQKLDQSNIIQFLGWFDTSVGKAMVFESLDISLEDFIRTGKCLPMQLSDVSFIIQQLATAFDALKGIGLIHTDLKLDNIMMVDHTKRPFGVKLIDFGLTMHRSKAKQGTTMQVVPYRALEIMLGLPFSEAIDMWSLGCVMAVLLYGKELFSADTEYEALHEITALLGVPPDHLLEKGRKTGKYFTKSECNTWRLKTHQEYWQGHANSHPQYQPKVRFSLDKLRRAHLESIDKCEALRTGWAVDLLEAMLSLDEAKRITPSQILTHPFITSGIYSHLIKKKKFTWKTQRTTQDQTEVPAGVILVCPAAAENRLPQDGPGGILPKENIPAGGTLKENIPAGGTLKENIPAGGILKENIPAGVILVRPAAAENRLLQDGPGEILLEEDIR
ncbi:homeodomain-interacting protein kinase 2-like [Centropristis striata]|uniref:homeodomain-interacting protein kinase 2-like n=1 Tax=Centropristis striata TaxID=184440 RepID=UPI0027DF3B4C|nr:homeodomain-interacting protein kinase 2-like [Centropristis striata]